MAHDGSDVQRDQAWDPHTCPPIPSPWCGIGRGEGPRTERPVTFPPLLSSLVGDPETEAQFTDGADLAAMLRVESALAEAEAAAGLIPAEHAARIAEACTASSPTERPSRPVSRAMASSCRTSFASSAPLSANPMPRACIAAPRARTSSTRASSSASFRCSTSSMPASPRSTLRFAPFRPATAPSPLWPRPGCSRRCPSRWRTRSRPGGRRSPATGSDSPNCGLA